MVDAFGIARDLGADHAGRVAVGLRPTHRADALAVQHLDLQGAGGGAVVRAGGVTNLALHGAEPSACARRPWQSGDNQAPGRHHMLTRRTLLASSAATVAAPAVLTERARRHAEGCRGDGQADRRHRQLRSSRILRVHQRRGGRQLLPPADPAEPGRCDQDRRRPGGEVGRQRGRPDLHLQAAPRRQVRFRQSGDRE